MCETGGGGGGGEHTHTGKNERQKEKREKTQNSELYYSRIKILGSCLFLQSVLANLHAGRLHIKQH